ncbi:MAG: hypothetical protein MUE88_03635 [Flavobacteriales bacterium]|jgi:hypothetical protein|nr:hypothetical protein [Flavobacteriales bacterium]
MRDELNLMELVDRYLGGELNASEQAAFEERLRTNAELRELVEDQRALHGGMKRLALRPAVNKAYRRYKWGKWAPGIGGAAVIAILAVGGWMQAKEGGRSMEAVSDDSEQVEQLLTLSDTAGTGLPALVMMINPKADTTLITPNGLVVDIPKGAFVDEAGRAITKPVRVTLLEAIDGVDIMKAGLSTTACDTLLETGGMFYLDAQMDGKRVGIDPAKPLTVMVPSDNADPRMMLYEGGMTAEGIVDWRNPKPLAHTLVPVDMSTLDFYPPGYLAKVAELGKDATDKAYTDSLYYSFNGTTERQVMWGADTMGLLEDSAAWGYIPPGETGIEPARIKAIWNTRFNGTNLATREFEERMREIHRLCETKVLDHYVNNLDKNLSELDAQVKHPAFARLAKRNDGRVQLPEHAAHRLRKVYTEWSQRYAETARKTQEEFYRKEAEADQEAHKRQMARQIKDLQQDSERFRQEFTASLRSVYDQLGYPWTPAPPPRAAFVVPVRNPGWWNVDKAVLAATTSRTSMSYTDKKSGKTATLTYTPITVEVASKESFSELRVYLIPKELNSYQRVMEKDGTFTENLNSLFEYDVICMGRKDGQQYAASQWNVGGERTIALTMEPTEDEALKRMIRVSTSVVSGDLLEQARHLEWLEREAKRQQAKQAHYALRNALMAVVFPCWGEGWPVEE